MQPRCSCPDGAVRRVNDTRAARAPVPDQTGRSTRSGRKSVPGAHFRPNQGRKLTLPVRRILGGGWLTAGITYWLDRPKELSFVFLSLLKSFESVTLMNYYKQYIDEAAVFAGGLFERAARNGELKTEDPKNYGFTLMGALDGILTYAVIYPEIDIEKLVNTVTQVWIDKN